ncbi:MAG: Crp/Fnr family transcriptional regulator [Burkholderiaceae bacterium]
MNAPSITLPSTLQVNPSLAPLRAEPNLLHRRVVPLHGQGSRAELMRLLGLNEPAPRGLEALTEADLWCVRAGAVLLREGNLDDTVFVVRSGSLKCVKTLEDGYEQVLAFAQPGDLLGYEALYGGAHPSTVIALEHATVYALPLAQLRGGAAWLDEGLRQGLSRQLARAAETAELMSAVTADVRLARFILWVSARMARAGQSPRRFHLRMGRRDIASFLGTAHETTSRSFTTLAELGLIAVDNREVEILDMAGLKARALATRGLGGERGQPVGGRSARRSRMAPWQGSAERPRTSAGAARVLEAA